ncbi:hypothetical protein [Bosea sp. BK604]|uniref:hypothetical protein n=1 Tax=Bosea sp. BK604 TaxID=2512180 RepID=UPI0010462D1F|nr:hypothetical protein [Bosea sp. BK604]TCR61680.1 hypothetical protein EV560_11219 [Bosea sp. BK604]
MIRKTLIASMFGAFALAGIGIGAPSQARADALPAGIAHQLDRQDVEFTMTAAKERRLMMMNSLNRQQRYGRGGYGRPGYGYNRGYGYGRGYGRGGYVRPQTGPGGRYIYTPGRGVRPYPY